MLIKDKKAPCVTKRVSFAVEEIELLIPIIKAKTTKNYDKKEVAFWELRNR